MKRSSLRRVSVFLCLLSMAAPAPTAAFAADGDQSSRDVLAAEVNRVSLGIGFTSYHLEGPGQFLAPYAVAESHPILRANAARMIGPGDFFTLRAEYEGSADHEADAHVILMGRLDAMVSVWKFGRNMPHRALPPSSGETPVPVYNPQDLNPGAEYGLDIRQVMAGVKANIPGYPAHVRASARQWTESGTIQQVFLDENCTTNCHNVSQGRDVKKVTREVSFGTDAHAGLVDLSYQYDSLSFKDEKPDPVYAYGTLTGLPRVGSVHNTYPKVKQVVQTLGASTNNTGKVTVSASAGMGKRENSDSGVTEDLLAAAGELVLRPNPDLYLTLRSRHQAREQEVTAAAAGARGSAGHPLDPSVQENLYTASASYSPLKTLTLRGNLTRRETGREHEAAWGLPPKTTSDSFRLGAEARPNSDLRVGASIEDTNTAHPAYPSLPSEERTASFRASWRVASSALLLASLVRAQGVNDSTGREDDRQVLHGSFNYSPAKDVSLGFSYDRFSEDVDSDLSLGKGAFLVVDPGAPYRMSGDGFAVQAAWKPAKDLEITGRASYLDFSGVLTVSAGSYAGMGMYSALKAVQMSAALGLQYALDSGWGLSTNVSLADYDDKSGSDAEDEQVREVSAVITRSW